jgi:hypothetical protein
MELIVHDVLAFHRVDRAAYEHLLSLANVRLQPAVGTHPMFNRSILFLDSCVFADVDVLALVPYFYTRFEQVTYCYG